jgi:hypothetical protein
MHSRLRVQSLRSRGRLKGRIYPNSSVYPIDPSICIWRVYPLAHTHDKTRICTHTTASWRYWAGRGLMEVRKKNSTMPFCFQLDCGQLLVGKLVCLLALLF